MKLRKLLSQRGLGVNLLAGFCFLMLAVYGWGLSWSDLAKYLLIIVVLLGGLIAFAALCGWLLRWLMARSDTEVRSDTDIQVSAPNKVVAAQKDESPENSEADKQ